MGLVALGLGVDCYRTLIGVSAGFVLIPGRLLLLLYPNRNVDLHDMHFLAVVFFNASFGYFEHRH